MSILAPPLPGKPDMPHNLQAEEALLGALLMQPEALPQLGANSAWFYERRNAWVYEALAALDADRTAIDVLTVCDELERQGHLEDVGGMTRVMQLLDAVPSAAHINDYSRIVRDAWARRELIRYAEHVVVAAWSDGLELSAVTDKVSTELAELLSSGTQRNRVVSARDTAQGISQQAEEYVTNPLLKGEVRHIPTGFLDLNTALGGWRAGNVIVVFAAPAVGKTYFNLHTALAAARAGRRVLIFSLEMNAHYLALRLALAAAKARMHEYERGQMTEQQWANFYAFCGQYSELPICYNDSASRLDEIVSVIEAEHLRQPLALVIIENLSLIEGVEVANRSEAYGALVRRLKLLAGALNVAVIVSHHISDKVLQQRADKSPEAGDVFASSEVNQKADVMLGMSRPATTTLRLHVLKDKVGGRAPSHVDLRFDEFGALHDMSQATPESAPVYFGTDD